MDASTHCLGWALLQEQNGINKVISYGGRNLKPAEIRCPISHKEALGLICALRENRSLLIGSKFYVFTDSPSLAWAKNNVNSSGRLARWSYELDLFAFEITHIRYVPSNLNLLVAA